MKNIEERTTRLNIRRDGRASFIAGLIGRHLKEERLRRDITSVEIAEQAGFTAQSIASAENGVGNTGKFCGYLAALGYADYLIEQMNKYVLCLQHKDKSAGEILCELVSQRGKSASAQVLTANNRTNLREISEQLALAGLGQTPAGEILLGVVQAHLRSKGFPMPVPEDMPKPGPHYIAGLIGLVLSANRYGKRLKGAELGAQIEVCAGSVYRAEKGDVSMEILSLLVDELDIKDLIIRFALLVKRSAKDRGKADYQINEALPISPDLPLDNALGQFVRLIRVTKKITQRAIIESSPIGQASMISRVEKGGGTIDTFLMCMDAIGMTPQLMGWLKRYSHYKSQRIEKLRKNAAERHKKPIRAGRETRSKMRKKAVKTHGFQGISEAWAERFAG